MQQKCIRNIPKDPQTLRDIPWYVANAWYQPMVWANPMVNISSMYTRTTISLVHNQNYQGTHKKGPEVP